MLYADQAALIDDPRVLRIAIADNGEPLVDLRSITALAVDHDRTDVQQLYGNPLQVRAGPGLNDVVATTRWS